MEKLLQLLKDGRSRSIEMLAAEMDTSPAVIKRDMEFLARMGMIRKIDFAEADGMKSACSECGGCGGKKKCASCTPGGGFENMGVMWEVVSALCN